MVKIKIIEIYGTTVYDKYGNDIDFNQFVQNDSDWDNVTETEFEQLKLWTDEQNRTSHRDGRQYFIATPYVRKPKLILREYYEKLKKIADEKAAKEQKKKDRETKRIATIAKKQKEKELRLLKELQSKYVKS